MAMRMLELDGYPAIGERARPALKLVENVPPAKLPPPAWMVAPTFRTEVAIGVGEELAPRREPMTMPTQGPYRSIREVPRVG